MLRNAFLSVAVLFLPALGCGKPVSLPLAQSPIPRPTIYVQTPTGRVPMSPDEAAAYLAPASTTTALAEDSPDCDPPFATDDLPFAIGSGPSARSPFLVPLSRPSARVERFGPVRSQYFYIRPEQTPTGYIEGRYGRVDNYTPGEHTSRGYVPGNYRGDGALYYTRPEHTSTGYIPGHYRAEPVPFGQPVGAVQMTPEATTSPTFGRPLGG